MIYVDANVVIRLVEGIPATRVALDARLAAAWGTPGTLLTSRLTRLECRVKPLRTGDAGLLARLEVFFAGPEVVLAEITADVIETAADLRAHFRVKTPDAIHLATAVRHGAAAFVTGDAALSRCTTIPVEVL